jgi:hypothetical protein
MYVTEEIVKASLEGRVGAAVAGLCCEYSVGPRDPGLVRMRQT